jgi:hypothetical protein
MKLPYNYRNCQSLFGYATEVHVKSQATCQLCGCGGPPVDFDLWRQLTVEHLLGRSQGGYREQIGTVVEHRFPDLVPSDRADLVRTLDVLNTVTACSFCNSTTSRDVSATSMTDLILATPGSPEDVVNAVAQELSAILQRKRADVQWKLASVRAAFERHVLKTPQSCD